MKRKEYTVTRGNHPLIYLEWCDAITSPHTWMRQEDAIEWAEEESWIVSEVGWVMKETKKYILMASRKNMEDEVCNFSGIMKIPKTWIIRKIPLQDYVNDQSK